MDKPISFSGYKRYTMCPKSFDYHYNEKYRPGKSTSALLFGSLLDEVLCGILLGQITDPDSEIKKRIEQVKNNDIDFYPEDFDSDLVDVDVLESYFKTLGWKGKDIISAIKDFLKDQPSLSENQLKGIRFACWTSLEVKACLMVDSFIKWILPKIDTVIDVQKHIQYDKDGYKIHGYLDFTCILKDGKRVLFDIKTAKMPYSKDAVLKSPQLALYSNIEEYEYAGFIVLVKTINKNKIKTCSPCHIKIEGGNTKNCPKCKQPLSIKSSPTSFSQFLVNKLPKRNGELTLEAIKDTIKSIDAGMYPRNLNQCFNMYGKDCPYVDKCWKNKE